MKRKSKIPRSKLSFHPAVEKRLAQLLEKAERAIESNDDTALREILGSVTGVQRRELARALYGSLRLRHLRKEPTPAPDLREVFEPGED